MHANKSTSVMESNSEGGCLSRMNKRKEADNCSCVDGEELHSKESRRCDNQQATSETSNLLSASSSHNSFSENAESKATSKASSAFDVDMPLKASSAAIVEKGMSEDRSDNISSVTGSRHGNAADNIEIVCLEKDNVTLISDSTKIPFSEGSQEVAEVVSIIYDHNHRRETGPDKSALLTARVEDDPQRNSANQLPPSTSVDNEQLHDLDDHKGSLDNSSSEEQETTLNSSLNSLESPVGGHLVVNNGCELKAAQSSNPEGEDQAGNERRKTSSGTSNSINLPLQNKNAKGLEIDVFECKPMVEIPVKLGSSVEDSNIPGTRPHPDSNSEKEISESEMEDDVKVCDICGDAGREECLAICSKCTDGAEHIYCMSIMMEKVPKGEWLCEDCKIKEQTENQKVNTSELLPGNSKPSSSNGKSQKDNDANTKILPKLQKKTVFPEDRGVEKTLQSLKTSSRKHTDLEVASENGNSIHESNSLGSPKKRSMLSRESSFKNSDIGRGKPGSLPAPYVSHSGQGSRTFICSQVHSVSDVPRGQQKIPTSRELFSKSSSFNNSAMKRKVKQLTDDIPLKRKLTKDSASKDMRKDGQARTLTKSTSFKGPCFGRIEAMAKAPNSSCVEDQKDLKQGKEWSMLGKKNSLMAERSVSLSPKSAVCAKSEFKVAQNEGKPIKMVEANESISKGSEEASDLGRKQIKRQLSSLEKSLNSSLSNGTCVNEIHRPTLHRSISQAADTTSRDNKGKDYVFSNMSRQAGQANGRIIRCQKCNETGHTSQYCSIDKLRPSALKPSAEHISREANTKSNKWKEIVGSAAVRSRIQSSKLFDQAEETSISSTDLSSNTKDLLPNSSSFSRNLNLLNGKSDGQASQSDYIAEVGNGIDVNQQVGSLSCIPNSGEVSTRLFTEKLPVRASLLGSSLSSSVIPEFSFIWQGSFEVHIDEGIPEICDGLQAHLSSCASSKVLNVVEKFPFNLKLEELPRRCLWPSQFERNCPKEDNIALFFFAKDIESYERNYKKLLDKILGNDLALKGNINGVDLLIFPSSVLPEKFQRWNMLFFLWGIFREKKMDSSEDLHRLQKRHCTSHLDVKPIQDAASSHITEIPFVQKPDPFNSSVNLSSVSIKLGKSSTNHFGPPEVPQCGTSSENVRKIHVPPESFTEASSPRSSEKNKLSSSLPPCSFPASSSKSISNSCGTCRNQNQSIPPAEKLQRLIEPETDVSYMSLYSNSDCRKLREPGAEFSGKNRGLPTVSTLPIPDKDEMHLVEEQTQVKTEPAAEPSTMGTDHLIRYSRGEKRSFSSTIEAVSGVSCETSRTIVETPERTCFTYEERQDHKKIKLRKYEEIFSNMSSNVRPLLPSLNESHPVEDTYDTDMVLQTSGSMEPKLFPEDNGSTINVKPHKFIDIVSSDDEEPQEAAPDLELGLGKKRPTEREILPLFLPLDRNTKQEKLPVDDSDDVSASLSLSLAFPDAGKDRKSEHLLARQSCRNNSLLLFGSFTDN